MKSPTYILVGCLVFLGCRNSVDESSQRSVVGSTGDETQGAQLLIPTGSAINEQDVVVTDGDQQSAEDSFAAQLPEDVTGAYLAGRATFISVDETKINSQGDLLNLSVMLPLVDRNGQPIAEDRWANVFVAYNTIRFDDEKVAGVLVQATGSVRIVDGGAQGLHLSGKKYAQFSLVGKRGTYTLAWPQGGELAPKLDTFGESTISPSQERPLTVDASDEDGDEAADVSDGEPDGTEAADDSKGSSVDDFELPTPTLSFAFAARADPVEITMPGDYSGITFHLEMAGISSGAMNTTQDSNVTTVTAQAPDSGWPTGSELEIVLSGEVGGQKVPVLRDVMTVGATILLVGPSNAKTADHGGRYNDLAGAITNSNANDLILVADAGTTFVSRQIIDHPLQIVGGFDELFEVYDPAQQQVVVLPVAEGAISFTGSGHSILRNLTFIVPDQTNFANFSVIEDGARGSLDVIGCLINTGPGVSVGEITGIRLNAEGGRSRVRNGAFTILGSSTPSVIGVELHHVDEEAAPVDVWNNHFILSGAATVGVSWQAGSGLDIINNSFTISGTGDRIAIKGIGSDTSANLRVINNLMDYYDNGSAVFIDLNEFPETPVNVEITYNTALDASPPFVQIDGGTSLGSSDVGANNTIDNFAISIGPSNSRVLLNSTAELVRTGGLDVQYLGIFDDLQFALRPEDAWSRGPVQWFPTP